MERWWSSGDNLIDQVARAFGPTQGCNIITAIQVPFQPGTMADAENKVSLRQGLFQQRLERSRIRWKANPEIDMRRNDTGQGSFVRRRS